MNDAERLLEKLNVSHSLSFDEYEKLIVGHSPDTLKSASRLADSTRREIYSNEVYIRGLIEIGNVCKNDCFYCGIRRSNKKCERYVLTDEQILSCCAEGYSLGFRTFVLQGGEGVMPVERVVKIVSEIHRRYPDCAITLSLGEYGRDEYQAMFDAGANRYLLRHETADKSHYEKLHPNTMSFDNRIRCLYYLKEIGFQVGCGFMVGSPYQTARTLAKDLKFIEEFKPDMCGIGPFIPQKDTPFGKFPIGSADLTVYLLSIIRLIKPNILLPATTALGTAESGGRERGILSGANVVMPNLSPTSVREKYALYDNKLSSGSESAQNLNELKISMEKIGYKIVESRGDVKV